MLFYAELGSLSHATMRPEDLIPRFVDALDELNEQRSLSVTPDDELDAVREFSRLQNILAEIERKAFSDHAANYFDSDDASYDLETLFDELNAFAPPFCYFGAHPGDGSDYGFWVSEDILHDGKSDDVFRTDDTSNVPAEFSGYVLHVNDHGNATLYESLAGELREVWSVV